MQATAIANTNIALIKYWGKINSSLNIPAVGSISITLKEMYTKTDVRFSSALQEDTFFLNQNILTGNQKDRVSKFLDIVREETHIEYKATVRSENNFPTAAGLASSASGFAALALAATRAAQQHSSIEELSILARRGSGSAARSILGGFVEMKTANTNDGRDSYAVQLADETYWPLNILVTITSEEKKRLSSTEGMNRSAATSPYYKNWISSSKADLQKMRNALYNRDLEKLGVVSEHNCLKMHSLAMSANPGILYWNGTTVDIIHAVREMRKKNIQAYFTIDAGPQVKIICEPENVQRIKEEIKQIDGVKQIIITSVGPDAKIIGD